uniref:Uncharacterized protein n=1 Tax=Escherichia coli TaxID=562 RepID=A0A6G8F7D8_ECOLX|nr:hypothetical protein p2_00062 [Escherichia coli]
MKKRLALYWRKPPPLPSLRVQKKTWMNRREVPALRSHLLSVSVGRLTAGASLAIFNKSLPFLLVTTKLHRFFSV